MDGRAQDPVKLLMQKIVQEKEGSEIVYVDMITEPGADKFTSCVSEKEEEELENKLGISIGHHGSRYVAVAGHDKCAGNPVSKGEHEADIKVGVKKTITIIQKILKKHEELLNAKITVMGIWVEETSPNTWNASLVLEEKIIF